MTTTDAEAIARIIDPDVFCFHKSMIEAGLKDGLSADEARATADRCTAHSIPPAVVKAERILSYLASRREAQEPIQQYRVRHCADWYDGHPDPTDGKDYETRVVYTTPPSPAPAGEVERLRGALNEIDALDPEEHTAGCSTDALRGLVLRMGEIARAALNGARHD